MTRHTRTTGSLSDVDRSRADAIKADGIQTRNVAIGVGVAGAVSLVTGVAFTFAAHHRSRLLATAAWALAELASRSR